jgi:ParB-like chromosome segregation protein Spo0J/preprotein translocase subunit YajC
MFGKCATELRRYVVNMRNEKIDLFAGGNDLQSVANEIYGGSVDVPDSGRVVARPTPINTIHADVKQPRRAIPINIRLHWDGNPASVPHLLMDWLRVAEAEAGTSIDVVALLNGEGDGIDSDKFPSVVQEFLALARLAQGIKADGLINPITVIESDGKLLIESGERRWLAFHLLHMHLGEQWAKIPAAKGNTNDSVWRQASENTQRRQLNAIGMARQIALLIMAARGTPPMASGTQYLEYEDVVKNGVSDRRFYAQVADGTVHRIPRGMGERIQAAMGLGMEQISQYRALLRLTDDELVNDALWTKADVENWPERALRDIATLTMVKVSQVISRANWTIDDLKALKEAPVSNPYPVTAERFQQPQQPPATTEWMNKTILTKAGFYGVVKAVNGSLITAEMEPDGKRAQFNVRDVTLVAADRDRRPPMTMTPPASTHSGSNGDPFTHKFAIGDTVRTRTGSTGEVVGVSGRLVTVKTINGSMVHDWSGLVKIEKPSPCCSLP